MSAIDAGYAIRRNNTCDLETEIDCGNTWANWHNCCPQATYCASGQYGNECWKTRSPPTDKRCANSTADLYYAIDFFCCDPDTVGFEVQSNGYVGCAPPNYTLPQGEVVMSVIVSGTVITTPSSETTTTTTPFSTTTTSLSTTLSADLSTNVSTSISNPSSTPTNIASSPAAPESSSKPGSNTGTIVGSVVGGAAGLGLIIVLFLWLLRRRAQGLQKNEKATIASHWYTTQGSGPAELNDTGRPHELESWQSAHELPAHSTI